MAKPQLPEPEASLERQLIDWMTAGLKAWRSDLDYPASYSDMQACARGIMARFDITPKPLPEKPEPMGGDEDESQEVLHG